MKRTNSIEIGVKNIPSKKLPRNLENRAKNLQISIMLSLKRENNTNNKESLVLNDHMNTCSSAHKRNRTSSNSNSSIHSNQHHQQQQHNQKRKRNNTYKLRVSFQKYQNNQSDINNNSSNSHAKQELSSVKNNNMNGNHSEQHSEVIEKIKVFFVKNKPESVSLLSTQDDPTTKFIAKLTNNTDKLNAYYYD